MATFITRLDAGASPGSLRVAVKDCIDVAGVPTTSGSPVVAADAGPAPSDAPCLAGLRAAGATIVGKANLHELCFGATGINPWYGTPVNPLDPALVPGGSSSGSAVAVATGEADFAIGTDTTGSVRTPAACCGVTALRPTAGRIPLDGVQPLAPTLDVVGGLAATVDELRRGMALLDPAMAEPADAVRRVARIRPPGADPVVEAAIDATLERAGFAVRDVVPDGWDDALAAGRSILLGEAWRSLGHLFRTRPDGIGDSVRERFLLGAAVDDDELAGARDVGRRWRAELETVLASGSLIVLPTLDTFAPRLDDPPRGPARLAIPASLAGLPALALPVPAAAAVPASLQLVGPAGSEPLLLATAAAVEEAAGYWTIRSRPSQ